MWTRSSKCDTGTCVEVETSFRSSSKCDSGACVEVGFHKSSRSFVNGDCVEVQCRCHENRVLVRDSKQVQAVGADGTYDVLSFSAGDWRQFLRDLPVRSRG